MIRWSGQNWYERPPSSRLTITVIEQPAETYEQYHQRKKREERDGKPRRVPFGFARVLNDNGVQGAEADEEDGPAGAVSGAAVRGGAGR